MWHLWVLCAAWWVPVVGCPRHGRHGTCGCWVVGSGCRMPQGRYLWVLGSSQLGNQALRGCCALARAQICPAGSKRLSLQLRKLRSSRGHCHSKGKCQGWKWGQLPPPSPLAPLGIWSLPAALLAPSPCCHFAGALVLWGIFISFFSGFQCGKQKALGFFFIS